MVRVIFIGLSTILTDRIYCQKTERDVVVEVNSIEEAERFVQERPHGETYVFEEC